MIGGRKVVVIVVMRSGLRGLFLAGGAGYISEGLGRREVDSAEEQDSDGHPNCALHLIILPQGCDPVARLLWWSVLLDLKNSIS